MPSWRCPHCSTPQAEASRCWVCHRSSTSCGTCREFRTSVAARFGFCGLDRTRRPLRGDEVRSCWHDGAVPVPPEPSIPGLLDLLTVQALGDRGEQPQTLAESEPPSSRAAGSRPTAAVGRRAVPSDAAVPAGDHGSRRLWVEVEV